MVSIIVKTENFRSEPSATFVFKRNGLKGTKHLNVQQAYVLDTRVLIDEVGKQDKIFIAH